MINDVFNNLKLAIRNLHRNGVYSVINIAGLAISLMACVFIVLWIQDETGYDRFHKDARNIYFAVSHLKSEGGDQDFETTPGMFAVAAKEYFDSDVDDYCRTLIWWVNTLKYGDKKTSSTKCGSVDPNFFDFFNFAIIKGNREHPLQHTNDVVISERLALRLFGDEDPIGKIIISDDIEMVMSVTAVMKNLPKNTMLNAKPNNNLDLICLFSDQFAKYHVLMNSQSLTNWTNNPFQTFIRIKKGANIDEIAQRVTALQSDERMLSIRSFSLLPLINKHLYTLKGEPAGIRTVRVFQWIALVILFIACINYVNLTTARASKRNREIGIRKIVGANMFKLFLHLIIESVVLFVIAIILAYLLNLLLLPAFNSLSGKKSQFGLFDPNVWGAYFVIFLTVVALAGIYPACLLASFRETNFAKNMKSKQGGNFFRQILVVAQFVASTILIAVTITLLVQMNFLRKKDIGYNRENMIISMLHGVQPQHQYEVFKSELERYPSVLGVTRSDDVITSITSINNRFDNWEGKVTDRPLTFRVLCCDTSYVRVMGLTIIDGTDFTSTSTGVIYSDNISSGSTTRTTTYTEKQYIINETAARAMGLKDPVGKWVVRPEWKIVGVVKDFHFESYHKPIEPLVMVFDPVYAWALHLRYRSGEVEQAVDALRNVWMKYKSEYPFSYWFLDGAFDTLYQEDAQTNRLFTIFSIIAIFISCLGLFGLVVFTAEMKIKEIGIRKVHGAGIYDITNLMLRGFLMLIGIAILIAIPLSYYLSSSILQRFAYRISLSWWIFVLSGIITVLLTLLTVSGIAVKSATKNPLEAIMTD